MTINKDKVMNNIEDCDTDVHTDRNMIKTVLRNFVSNAVKFTPEGGTVTIYCNSDQNYYYIVTKDSGVGMEPNKLNELFRMDKITTTTGTNNETGTGLGLIVANEFVKKCDGEILVESEPGNGSKFTIKLPK